MEKKVTLEDDQYSESANEEGKQLLRVHAMPPRINMKTLGLTNKSREQTEDLQNWLGPRTPAPELNFLPRQHTHRNHSVPVYKWRHKFDGGHNQSIGAFLEMVEELSRARGVRHTEFFGSAVDLISGTALVWYRSTVQRIKTWDELFREMRTVFRSPDYEFRLTKKYSTASRENKSHSISTLQ